MSASVQAVRKSRISSELVEFWSYRELLKNLIVRELKLQYRGSFLGFLWSLLHPALLALVYYIVFTKLLIYHFENFALWLLVGILHWQLFQTAVTSSTNALLGSANLITNVHFPRLILPMATVGSKFLQHILAALVFFLALVPLGGHYWLGIVVYPLVLALQTIFILGVALGVSVLTVYFRDLKHLVEVALRFMFWGTPIIYMISNISENLQLVLHFNPMTAFVISYQSLFWYIELPSANYWGLMTMFALASLFLGLMLFRRFEPLVEDYL